MTACHYIIKTLPTVAYSSAIASAYAGSKGRHHYNINKMKKLLITLTLAIMAVGMLSAQTQTLFNRTRVVGGFGAPIVEIGLSDNYNTAIGGGGAVLINSFFVGGYGMASLDFEELLTDDGDLESVELAHGGLWLGFSFPSDKLLHFYGSTRIGWGAIDIAVDRRSNADLDQVFVLTPEIGIELNVTRWFRLAGTIGYRYLDGANEDANALYTNDDFRGSFAGITLRFGGFGNRWRNKDNW